MVSASSTQEQGRRAEQESKKAWLTCLGIPEEMMSQMGKADIYELMAKNSPRVMKHVNFQPQKFNKRQEEGTVTTITMK